MPAYPRHPFHTSAPTLWPMSCPFGRQKLLIPRQHRSNPLGYLQRFSSPSNSPPLVRRKKGGAVVHASLIHLMDELGMLEVGNKPFLRPHTLTKQDDFFMASLQYVRLFHSNPKRSSDSRCIHRILPPELIERFCLAGTPTRPSAHAAGSPPARRSASDGPPSRPR